MGDHKPTRIRSAFTMTLAVIAILAGCSNAQRPEAGGAGAASAASTGCVDAVGDNSSTDEVVNAAMDAAYVDPVTGKTSPVVDELLRQQPGMNRPMLFDSLKRNLFSEVPPGGDAAFARAVCELKGWKPTVINGSYLLSDLPIADQTGRNFGNTRHLLRGFGRNKCLPASDGVTFSQQAQRQADKNAREAEQNPESYRQFLLDQIAVREPESAQTARTWLSSQSPTDLVAHAQFFSQINHLAVQYQCPQAIPG